MTYNVFGGTLNLTQSINLHTTTKAMWKKSLPILIEQKFKED